MPLWNHFRFVFDSSIIVARTRCILILSKPQRFHQCRLLSTAVMTPQLPHNKAVSSTIQALQVGTSHYWHVRRRCNDVSGPLFSPSFVFLFSLLSMFLMEGLLKSKTYRAKVVHSVEVSRDSPLSTFQTKSAILEPLWCYSQCSVTFGAVLQAVSIPML